ncbi:hypothetical protein XENTR_v10022801 [Xenopus tropicalis]|nr:hypothetical protein XENTR_v10022801 [Xenopus tropicalis]
MGGKAGGPHSDHSGTSRRIILLQPKTYSAPPWGTIRACTNGCWTGISLPYKSYSGRNSRRFGQGATCPR